MSYYVVKYKEGAPGCPLALKGKLNLDWQWDEFSPNPDKFNLDGDYTYSVDHRLIDFDFWNQKCLASADFVDLALDAYPASPLSHDSWSSNAFKPRWQVAAPGLPD